MLNTVDTGVVVLAVIVAAILPAGMEVWLAFGAGKHIQYIAAYLVLDQRSP